MAKTTSKKRGRPKKEKVVEVKKQPMSKAGKIAILIVLIALFTYSLIKVGPAGLIANNIMSLLFGKFFFIVLLTLLFFFIKVLFYSDEKKMPFNVTVGVIILNLAVLMLGAYFEYKDLEVVSFELFKNIFSQLTSITSAQANYGGGLIGSLLYVGSVTLFDKGGAFATLIILFLISAILIIPLTYFYVAFKTSKDAAKNAATSLEEKRIKAIEDRKKKKEEQEEEKNQKKLEELTAKKLKEEEILNDEDEEEYVENTSVFSKKYFLNADESLINNKNIKKTVNDYKESKPTAQINKQPTLEEANEPKIVQSKTLRRVSNFKGYKLPNSKELLAKSAKSKDDKNESTAELRGKELIKILSNFGIKATLIDYSIGPSVTKFEIKPDATVNLSRINSLSDNIKMGLAATSIRIEAPIPGKNAVGVEVPNVENSIVRMSELINNVPKNKVNNKLIFALGKDLGGEPVFCDLAKMPHLLIAGATGSGKSVCINSIITSYLLRTKPDEVKMILVDPKKVEFTPYHDVPHLLWPVITDAKTASMMLKKMVIMMEERYELFSKAAVRDITSYNEKVDDHNSKLAQGEEAMARLPYIVVIIDELADLMQTSKNEVEASITRITQLARASGIHLIVATQRPSTDVITGLIKSNIPSRISFAVSSAIDSRTILDATGAEELLGNGDMLYSPQGENNPKRLQGCWVSDDEIEKVTNYVKSLASPEYDDTYFALQRNSESGVSNATSGEDDELYQEVVEFIAKTKKASTSSLQRRFGIGYNRAARLIDTLEENGLVGPANGSKPREVYVRNKEDE